MVEKKQERRGLGRGLSALMADVETAHAPMPTSDETAGTERTVPVEKLQPNPDQPRRDFSESDLADLANSIREKGIIQPLIVRKHPTISNSYEIVAGERRWRAAQMAQLHDVPVIVRDFDDTEVLEIAIIENVQRSNLNPVEEALGYQQLMERFGHTQDKLAQALSKSRSYIANLVRLLQLPDDVLALLRRGDLTTGHARALITTNNPSELARLVIKGRLSVRETEKLAKNPKAPTKAKIQTKPEKDADTKVLENDLTANLGMRVSIDHKPGHAGGGQVTVRYASLDELDDLCRILTATK